MNKVYLFSLVLCVLLTSVSMAFAQVQPVPEPSTWAMVVVGLAGVAAVRYLKKKK